MVPRSHILVILFLVLAFGAHALDSSKDSLLLVLMKTDVPSERMPLLNMLAGIYIDEDPVQAENFASQAMLIAESIQDPKGRAEASFYLGILAQKNGRFEEAWAYFRQAEDLFLADRDDLWLARVGLALSVEFKRNLEYEKALTLLFKAMNTFEEKGELKELGKTYNAIGGNFYDQANYDRALEFYNKSLVIFEELDEELWKGRLYNNLGEIYRFRGEYNKAIDLYRKSHSIFFQFNDPNLMAINYTNQGNTFLEMNQLDSAERYLSLGRELSKLSNDPSRVPAINISLGKLERAKGNWQAALDHLLMGYQQSNRLVIYPTTLEAARLLSELYRERQDYEQAYNYFSKYRNIDDSLHQASNMSKITQLEMSLLYELENESRRVMVQRVNLKYFTIAFILISIILVVILLYGRQRIRISQNRILGEKLQIEKVQLTEEIDNKNRELTTNVMFLVKKNEMITYISEKLLGAKTEFKPSIRKAVDEILIDLRSNLDVNIWQTFEERFRDVHRDFYRNLDGQFPNLSENDRKLCAFIRLNMNTKEIAAITHQNPNSIEVARTRLRKKLNISNTEISLNNFLANI